MNYRIGVDVSGGDHAPYEMLKGAFLAKEEFDEEIVLIGVKEEIEREASKRNIRIGSDFSIVDAPEKIDMAESGATSVRRKRNSSIVVG
ncbi:MAG: phosphate--acyl-ACP acyltransferase, partial [Candidatus Omnitrophota bacterium]